MEKYLITEEEVTELKNLLNSHKTIKVKVKLRKLKPYEDKLRNELEKYLRNKGRTSILEADIREILYKTKSKEVKMEETETEEVEKPEETTEEKPEIKE